MFTMLTITPWQQARFGNVWMFYIYLTMFLLEIRDYIIGAINRFKPKFHDLISISFLHDFSLDSISTIYVKKDADERPEYRRRAIMLSYYFFK
jgi:hypothetical protein